MDGALEAAGAGGGDGGREDGSRVGAAPVDARDGGGEERSSLVVMALALGLVKEGRSGTRPGCADVLLRGEGMALGVVRSSRDCRRRQRKSSSMGGCRWAEMYLEAENRGRSWAAEGSWRH